MKISAFLLGLMVPVATTATAMGAELLRSSFDDETSVLTPAVGTGVGASISSSPANDFVAGNAGQGLLFDAVTERVLYAQTDGSTNNVDLHVGTMTMWYRPGYASTDPTKTTIFGTGQWQSPGSVHIGKHNPSNDNDIFVMHFDDAGAMHQSPISHVDFSWSADTWIFLRLTWDFTVAAGEQNYHFYIDEVEIPFSTTANGPPTTGPFDMGTESASNYIYIGARDDAGPIIPWGVHDEITIHDEVVPPESSGAGGAGGAGGDMGTSAGGSGAAGGDDTSGGADPAGGGGDDTTPTNDGDSGAESNCHMGSAPPQGDGWPVWLLALGLAVVRRRQVAAASSWR